MSKQVHSVTQKEYYSKKIIVDLGICHDTRYLKYHKRSNTNGEMVEVLLSLEYRMPGKGSWLIRFDNQKEL